MKAQRAHLDRFAALLAQHLGLAFDESKRRVLDEVLTRRLAARGRAPDAYLAELEATHPPPEEMRALARELTVGETYFFRNHEQFDALSQVVIPERIERHGLRRMVMLSLGCSSGEEPYTLAMIVAEQFPQLPRPLIRGVDLNPAALEKAALGRYSQWSLRETPPAARERWFKKHGNGVLLDERLRASVELLERNLVARDNDFLSPETYDVIFCRNMLMYLTPRDMHAAVARIARALLPGGYFFLGHAETLRGISDEFDLCQSHGTFYYRRKPRLAAHPAPWAPAAVAEWRATTAELDAAPPDASWFGEVQRAHDRVRALTDDVLARPDREADRAEPATPPFAAPAASVAPAPLDLTQAMELLHQERFDSALDLLDTLQREVRESAEALLLRAVLLNHEGRQDAAEDACRALLAHDPRHAGAHYVLGLCREAAGDFDGATSNHRAAVHLDAAFAMPRLHLGRLARRAGNSDEARRQLGQAMVLLRREDAARLLMFGGGFRREALVAVCAAELGAAGGKP